jgi:signal transduction histidine kinase
MDAQLNRLTKLISDLLDISKIQAGKLELQEEPVDLTALVHETGENVQGTTTTHLITIEAASGICVMGDRDRLGQVLINLLTNAIKYSPRANSVILRAVTDGECVTVSVQDFGIGIADAYHQQIFERFYQVTEPQEQTYPGLGIGLYIVRDIVKRHHGEIRVESSKGNGSTFFFTLPLYAAESSDDTGEASL